MISNGDKKSAKKAKDLLLAKKHLNLKELTKKEKTSPKTQPKNKKNAKNSANAADNDDDSLFKMPSSKQDELLLDLIENYAKQSVPKIKKLSISLADSSSTLGTVRNIAPYASPANLESDFQPTFLTAAGHGGKSGDARLHCVYSQLPLATRAEFSVPSDATGSCFVL